MLRLICPDCEAVLTTLKRPPLDARNPLINCPHCLKPTDGALATVGERVGIYCRECKERINLVKPASLRDRKCRQCGAVSVGNLEAIVHPTEGDVNETRTHDPLNYYVPRVMLAAFCVGMLIMFILAQIQLFLRVELGHAMSVVVGEVMVVVLAVLAVRYSKKPRLVIGDQFLVQDLFSSTRISLDTIVSVDFAPRDERHGHNHEMGHGSHHYSGCKVIIKFTRAIRWNEFDRANPLSKTIVDKAEYGLVCGMAFDSSYQERSMFGSLGTMRTGQTDVQYGGVRDVVEQEAIIRYLLARFPGMKINPWDQVQDTPWTQKRR